MILPDNFSRFALCTCFQIRVLLPMVALFSGLVIYASSIAVELVEGEKTVTSHCAVCHKQADGELSRVTTSRRTPEGWDMTITRMR